MEIQSMLTRLFDYQRFIKNPKLSQLISETIEAYEHNRALSDDEVDVWAAGEADTQRFTRYKDE